MENKQTIGFAENPQDVSNVIKHLDNASLCDLTINDNGVEKPVNRFKGVYNNTKGQVAGVVSNNYNLIQHGEYFETVANSLKDLNIAFESEISQFNNTAVMDITFKDQNLKFDKLNEEFATGMRLMNSYNRSTGLIFAPKYTRLACSNGMVLSRFAKEASVKHTSSLLNDLTGFIKNNIENMVSTDAKLKEYIIASRKNLADWKSVAEFLHNLIPVRKHREKILEKVGIGIAEVENKKTKKKEITYFPEKETDKINRWDLYNAITSYITHEEITTQMDSYLQTKAEKVLSTPFEKLKKAEIKVSV